MFPIILRESSHGGGVRIEISNEETCSVLPSVVEELRSRKLNLREYYFEMVKEINCIKHQIEYYDEEVI